MGGNKDQKTVEGFGDEWERFDQTGLSEREHKELFEKFCKDNRSAIRELSENKYGFFED